MSPWAPVAVKLLIPVVKKLFPKPKQYAKEASLIGIISLLTAIYDQYQIGGIEAIDTTTVTALSTMVWVLGARLYHKHKDSN